MSGPKPGDTFTYSYLVDDVLTGDRAEVTAVELGGDDPMFWFVVPALDVTGRAPCSDWEYMREDYPSIENVSAVETAPPPAAEPKEKAE